MKVEKLSNIKKFKLSMDASKEDLQRFKRENFNNPYYIVNDEEYQEFQDNNKAYKLRKQELTRIGGEHFEALKRKEDRESIKKRKELNDLLNYIYESKEEIELVAVGEAPDFVVLHKGEKYAVEHTGLYDQEVIAEINALERMLLECTETLRAQNVGKGVLFNVLIIPNSIVIKNMPAMRDQCTAFLQALILGVELDPPEFISSVSAYEHPQIEVCLAESYVLQHLSNERIERTIREKEAKIADYKKNSGVDKVWLLVVVDGASAKSNMGIDLAVLPERSSDFDKIIVLQGFKGTIIEGKPILE